MSNRISIIDFVTTQTQQYKIRLSSTITDTREYIALIDYHIRIAATITSTLNKSLTGSAIKISNIFGVGEMISCIDSVKKWNICANQLHEVWRNFSVDFLFKISSNIYKGKNFKVIRDELSHGHPLPTNDQDAFNLATSLAGIVSDIEGIYTTYLADFFIQTGPSVLLTKENNEIALSPLWDFSNNIIGIYSTIGTDGIYYISPKDGVYINGSSENYQKFCNDFLKSQTFDRTYAAFIYDILKDVRSFDRRNAPPTHYLGEGQDNGIVSIFWHHSTSDTTTSRLDRFRIGRENRSEWECTRSDGSSDWVGYSEFLKE